MIGSLRRNPRGRFDVVNEEGAIELTHGDCLDLFVAAWRQWVSGSIGLDHKRGYFFEPDGGSEPFPLLPHMIADTSGGEEPAGRRPKGG